MKLINNIYYKKDVYLYKNVIISDYNKREQKSIFVILLNSRIFIITRFFRSLKVFFQITKIE